MAFGRLVNMFHILSGKIEGRIDRVSATLMACARLHNCILHEERLWNFYTEKIVWALHEMEIYWPAH